MFLASLVLAAQLWSDFGGITLPEIANATSRCAPGTTSPPDAIGIEPQSVRVEGANVTVVFNLPVPPEMARRISDLDLEAPYYTKLDDQQTQYTDAKAYIDPQISVPVVVRFEGLRRGAHRLRAGYFQIQKRARKATVIESHFEACFRTPGRLEITTFKKSAP
jgi:hypothetical protein